LSLNLAGSAEGTGATGFLISCSSNFHFGLLKVLPRC
jgi:hypothetical protein